MARMGDDTMIFRLPQKLNTKVKAGTLHVVPLHENPFADWSAHLFVADRTQYLLLSNTKSLLSTVLPGKGMTTASQFIERSLSNIRALMKEEGQEFAYERFIAPVSASVRFAKALDRSVTGSMNDLINHATAWLTEADLSPPDVAIRLNDILLSAIAKNKTEAYGKPREAFKALLGSTRS
jgi:hypothetical protein